MHLQKGHSNKLTFQAESDAELASPFLDSEIFSDTQLLESESLKPSYELFQQDSPFLKVFENPILDLDEAETQEIEDYLYDEDDDELDQGEIIYKEEHFVDGLAIETEAIEEDKSKESDGYLDDESGDEEWAEVDELEDDEIYVIEESGAGDEFANNETDYESNFEENEIDIEEEEDESCFDDTEDEFEEGIEKELLTYNAERERYQSDDAGEVDLDTEEEFHESPILESVEGEGDFDKDLEWSAEEVSLVESYIPASKLSWRGASPEQLKFMQKVYRAHVAWSSKRRSFISSLPEGKITHIEKVSLQKDAASALEDLLESARKEIKELNKNIKIEIVSGYRSANRQFQLWPRRFRQYYKRTQKDRSMLHGGVHGNESVELMTRYIRGRFAAPGYSLHQSGIAVDLQPTENRKRFINSTKKPHRENWRTTWFWKWLNKNAATYGYFQNNNINEPWHWEYRGNNRAKPKLPQRTVGADDINSWDSVIEKAKDIAASGKSLYIAMAVISKGERDENKITDAVFYAKYPSKKGKLKPRDPLVKDWLNIKSNLVRPLLSALKDTRNNEGAAVLKGKKIANVDGSSTSNMSKIRKYQRYFTTHNKRGSLTKAREGMHLQPKVPSGNSGVTLAVGIDLTTFAHARARRIKLARHILASKELKDWILSVPELKGEAARKWLRDNPIPEGGLQSRQFDQIYEFGRNIFSTWVRARLLGRGPHGANYASKLNEAQYNDLALNPAAPKDDFLLELLIDLMWNANQFARGRQNKIAQALTAENVKGDRYEKQIAQLGNLRDFIERGTFGGIEGRWKRLGWIDARIDQLRLNRSER